MGQPLLLTDPTALSASTANELAMITHDHETTRPRSIVIFGGTGALSDRVIDLDLASPIRAGRSCFALLKIIYKLKTDLFVWFEYAWS